MRVAAACAALLLAFPGCDGEEGGGDDSPGYDPRPGIVDTPLEEQK